MSPVTVCNAPSVAFLYCGTCSVLYRTCQAHISCAPAVVCETRKCDGNIQCQFVVLTAVLIVLSCSPVIAYLSGNILSIFVLKTRPGFRRVNEVIDT